MEVEADATECIAEEVEAPDEPLLFQDLPVLQDLIERMTKNSSATYQPNPEGPEAQSALSRLEVVVDRYLEAPHLVCAHLGEFVPALVEGFRARLPPTIRQPLVGPSNSDNDPEFPKTAFHLFARALYVVSKVSGNRLLAGYFPVAVANLELVFHTLREWQTQDRLHWEWEVRYSLLLWLSNLILAPFPLAIIDSSVGGLIPLSRMMLTSAQELLSDPSRCREGAALFIGRLLSRPDAAQLRDEFFTFAARAVQSDNRFLASGTLLALATTLKLGKREELLTVAFELLPLVTPCCLTVADSLLSKAAVKTVSRLLLCCLEPGASHQWKYQRRVMNLEQNLGGVDATRPGATAVDPASSAMEPCIAADIEVAVDSLIQALAHPDTIVRWSAAKGIGRLCEQLSKTAADDVIGSVMGFFECKENDFGWHGACLALAELAKRGLLLLEYIPRVVDITTEGLQYDLSRGSYSVGAHVRDAACYVCWSISRAYNPEDLGLWAQKMGAALVCTALFDREVNVRRASAAAFQEAVGRLGCFPHGISLVQTLDFFSLSTVSRCFTEVAPEVSSYPEYRQQIMDHLITLKIKHWDKNIRTLAATSFGKVIQHEPELEIVAKEMFPKLVIAASAEKTSVPERHGALLTLAQAISAPRLTGTLSDDVVRGLFDIIPQLSSKRLFRGRGGELIRGACCSLINALVLSNLELPVTVTIKTIREAKMVSTHQFLLDFLEECWKQPLEWLQSEAAATLKNYLVRFGLSPEIRAGPLVDKLLSFAEAVRTPNERRGALLVLAVLPLTILQQTNVLVVLGKVASISLERSVENPDAETRRNAVRALTDVFLTFALALQDDSLSTLVVESLHQCMEDYAVDKRGDVGSFVRLEAMRCYEKIFTAILDNHVRMQHFPLEKFWWNFCSDILKQAVEKIDRVRGVAGSILRESLHRCQGCKFPEMAIPELEVIASSNVSDWSSPSETFPIHCQLLAHDRFQTPLLSGIIHSVGGLSAHVVKAALPAVLKEFAGPRRAPLTIKLIDILRKLLLRADPLENERVILPFFVTANKLLLNDALEPALCSELLEVATATLNIFAKDAQRLLGIIPFFASCCLVSQCRTAAWALMAYLIGSRYPKVRSTSASELFTSLTCERERNHKVQIDEAIEILSTTQWDGTNAAQIRSARDRVASILDVVPFKLSVAAEVSEAKSSGSSTYKALVREVGY